MEPPKLSPLQRDLAAVFVLLTVGVAIYGQTLGFPFISFDDPDYVYGNPHVQPGLTREGWTWAWTSFAQSNWHPLTWLSLMLDAQLYGLNANGYHLTNLCLHLANTVLLYVWLRTATRSFWPGALTAFFFVAHPLHVESVAWVTERKDVLSTLFFFLTLLAYTRYTWGRGPVWYWGALGLFALGLTAKPMLVTLPPLLLLLDFWPLHRQPPARWPRLLREKTPFFLLMIVSCVVTILAQRDVAMVPLKALPPTYRLASAMLGYGAYLQKTLWPVKLGIYYPYWRSESMLWPLVWGASLLTVTAAVSVAPPDAFLLVGWSWFLGTLVPVIGVVQVGGQAVADRYTYLPHVGLFIAVFWAAGAGWRRWPSLRPALTGVTAFGAAACVLLAHRQASYWQNSVALFQRTASIAVPSPRLYRLLADALLETGRSDEATDVYLQSLRLSPGGMDVASSVGALLLRVGRNQEVIDLSYRWRDDPAAYPELLNQLGLALTRCGRADEAVKVYRRCQDLHPDYALARFGLADVLRSQGDLVGSVAEDQAGLVLRDDWLPALTRLAWGYAQSSDPQARAAALALARRAVTVSGGRDLASLSALAQADAAVAEWPDAVKTGEEALLLAQRTGAPVGALAICSEQLAHYRRHELPTPSVALR